MRRDTLRQKLFTRRAAILAGGQGLLLAAIGGRMYQLQILDSERYAVLADENRRYPFGETTAHIVGYVAAVSEQELDGDPLLEMPDFRIGKSAVEKSQDLELRGTAGTSQVEVNALGRVVRELARVAGKPGQDVVTSLDM